jgi:metallopeptidase MepB
MANVRNFNTRKVYFLGNENKCKNNLTLFKELVTARAELAKLLGYKSYVDYALQDRMMSEELMAAFLENLRQQIITEGEKEMNRLRQIKRRELESMGFSDIDDRIYIWDSLYYTRLMKEQAESFDEIKLSEYFPLEPTINGLLNIFEALFGIKFVKVDASARAILMEAQDQPAEVSTWHEDVVIYAVWNEPEMDGEFLGYLYLDLLEREGKQNHPCMVPIRAVSRKIQVCNWVVRFGSTT